MTREATRGATCSSRAANSLRNSPVRSVASAASAPSPTSLWAWKSRASSARSRTWQPALGDPGDSHRREQVGDVDIGQRIAHQNQIEGDGSAEDAAAVAARHLVDLEVGAIEQRLDPAVDLRLHAHRQDAAQAGRRRFPAHLGRCAGRCIFFHRAPLASAAAIPYRNPGLLPPGENDRALPQHAAARGRGRATLLIWANADGSASMNATFSATMTQYLDDTHGSLKVEWTERSAERVAGRLWSPKPVKPMSGDSWTVDVTFAAASSAARRDEARRGRRRPARRSTRSTAQSPRRTGRGSRPASLRTEWARSSTTTTRRGEPQGGRRDARRLLAAEAPDHRRRPARRQHAILEDEGDLYPGAISS